MLNNPDNSPNQPFNIFSLRTSIKNLLKFYPEARQRPIPPALRQSLQEILQETASERKQQLALNELREKLDDVEKQVSRRVISLSDILAKSNFTKVSTYSFRDRTIEIKSSDVTDMSKLLNESEKIDWFQFFFYSLALLTDADTNNQVILPSSSVANIAYDLQKYQLDQKNNVLEIGEYFNPLRFSLHSDADADANIAVINNDLQLSELGLPLMKIKIGLLAQKIERKIDDAFLQRGITLQPELLSLGALSLAEIICNKKIDCFRLVDNEIINDDLYIHSYKHEQYWKAFEQSECADEELQKKVIEESLEILRIQTGKSPVKAKETLIKKLPIFSFPIKNVVDFGDGANTSSFIVRDNQNTECVIKFDTLSDKERERQQVDEKRAEIVYGERGIAKRVGISEGINLQEKLIPIYSLIKAETDSSLPVEVINTQMAKGEIPEEIKQVIKNHLSVFKQLLFMDLWAKMLGFIPDYQFQGRTSIPNTLVLTRNFGVDGDDNLKIFDFDLEHINLLSDDARGLMIVELKELLQQQKKIYQLEDGVLCVSDDFLTILDKAVLESTRYINGIQSHKPQINSGQDEYGEGLRSIVATRSTTGSEAKICSHFRSLFKLIVFGDIITDGTILSESEAGYLRLYAQYWKTLLDFIIESENYTGSEEEYINKGLQEYASNYS